MKFNPKSFIYISLPIKLTKKKVLSLENHEHRYQYCISNNELHFQKQVSKLLLCLSKASIIFSFSSNVIVCKAKRNRHSNSRVIQDHVHTWEFKA